jgi:transcriptional regulator with XRE-family HTH domain
VSPEAIKELRKELACTARELATSIGTDQATVLAWEKAELFPTKADVVRMHDLQTKGPGAIVRKTKTNADPLRALADPQIWTLLRKLVAHKALRDEVAKLAERYPDPAEP